MKKVALVLAMFGLVSVVSCPPHEARKPVPEPLRLRMVLDGAKHVPALFKYTPRDRITPTALVVHSTSRKLFFSALRAMEDRDLAVHVLIDTDGTAFQLVDHLEDRIRATRGLDDSAIHISMVGGIGKDLLSNGVQIKKAMEVVKTVAAHYAIPLNNYDVAGKRGIFSHTQIKYRFGGFLPNDPQEPGEEVMKYILEGIGGKYHPEPEWKDRGGPGWLFIAETSSGNATRGELDRGRGMTPTPKAALAAVVQDRFGKVPEERRIRYIDRGKITVTGVVLHFTATKEYKTTIRSLEERRLWPTLIADVDGSAYQVLDRMEDKPAAAAGTNDQCVQIEIVGKDEAEILANRLQKKKVVEVVKQLCEKYDIPVDNHDIESNKGIFSHGQAKKRFGRSAWLNGDDFDPGETYMKEIIEGAGGKYYPEKDWKDRLDEKWAFLYDTWTP